MSLPDKPVKHIARKQAPIGAVRDDRIKVMDGKTGKVRWRKGRGGFARDWDGDPIAVNYNRSRLKSRPKHSPRMGKRPMHRPNLGRGEQPGEE